MSKNMRRHPCGQATPDSNALKNALHLRDAHALSAQVAVFLYPTAVRDEERKTRIATAIEVAPEPKGCFRTKVNLPLFIALALHDGTPPRPVQIALVESVNFPDSAPRCEEELNQGVLKRTFAGIPEQFDLLNRQSFRNALRRSRFPKFHGRVAQEELLLMKPLEEHLDYPDSIRQTRRLQVGETR